MKLNIDHLDDLTGWVVTSPSTIAEIEEKKYIAGLNDKSLLITFDSADIVRTATKTFSTPFDVSDYESLVMSIWSRTKGEDSLYIKPTDFSYKIDIDGVREFYIPVYSGFVDITIGIEDVAQITQIKITPLHSDTDSIIISEMVAEKQEIPLDILDATKEQVDYYIQAATGSGLLIGTVTGTTGDTSVTLSNPEFIDRYGVILISGGGNIETHQVDDNNSGVFTLNDNFDGNSLLNDYTGADVYLQYPSFINPGQYEIRLPGISIWGIEADPFLYGSKLETRHDSFLVSGGSKQRIQGQLLKYTILIDCESRSQELIDIMTRAVRVFIAQEMLWINGRRHDIFFSGPAVESPTTSGIDYIPKVQYSFDVEIEEQINDRQAVPATTTISIPVEVQEV